KPGDFFAVANGESGRDLTPFFDQVYRNSVTFDYGVQNVRTSASEGGSYHTDVLVRRYADGIFPVTVLVTFADGAQTRFSWDGGSPWKLFSIDHPTAAVSA